MNMHESLQTNGGKVMIDMSDAPCQRILDYVLKVENPCSYYMEGYNVELEWKDTDVTLQDKMKEIFASIT